MTALEGVMVRRAAEQLAFIARAPSMRRRWCACGCGTWFYAPARLYIDRDHYNAERRNRRRRQP